VGARAIRHRLENGRLHSVFRGVHAVGYRRLSREGRWMAAVLAVGGDAVLSHTSAAGLLGIRYRANVHIEVTAPRRVRAPVGVRVHRRGLPADEVTVVRAIPVTSAPRTLLDLATVLDPRQVERAIEEAEVRRLDDRLIPGGSGGALSRPPRNRGHQGHPGRRPHWLHDHTQRARRRLPGVPRGPLPTPPGVQCRIQVGGPWIEADCVWRRQRLVVELEGAATHGTSAAYERDRARDRSLHAAGWRVVRVTWRQLHRDADQRAADLRGLLKLAPVPSR
jgi:REase_MTES_1575